MSPRTSARPVGGGAVRRLGDPFGSTLVAAHIDSKTQGLGPYAELLSVRAGARIVVRSAHLRQVFRVTSLRLTPRAELAGDSEIFAVSGPRRLTMVTCAGPYDADRGGYQNLAIVTALPATGPRPRSRDEAARSCRVGTGCRPTGGRRPPDCRERPDVTTPSWVAWFERSMLDEPRRRRAGAAEARACRARPSRRSPPRSRPETSPWTVRRRAAPGLLVIAAQSPPRGRGPLVLWPCVLGAWWWQHRGEPDPAAQAKRVDAPSRTQVPSAPVSLPAGGRHTQVVVTATGDLEVQVWQRSRDGSVAYVRYRLAGALERAGTRALARLPAPGGRSTPTATIAFTGATVLSLACVPTTGGEVPVPCGTDAGAGSWQLVGPERPGSEVLVQLDLS